MAGSTGDAGVVHERPGSPQCAPTWSQKFPPLEIGVNEIIADSVMAVRILFALNLLTAPCDSNYISLYLQC